MRFMDYNHVKLADISISKTDMEFYEIIPVSSRMKVADLPVTCHVLASELLYALAECDKYSKAEFEVKSVYNCRRSVIEVERRKPETCPKCGNPTVHNLLLPDQRGPKGTRYKCGWRLPNGSTCNWRGKVRVWKRKERVWTCEPTIKESEFIVCVDVGSSRDRFTLNLLDEHHEEVPVPKVDFKVLAKVDLGKFVAKLERLKQKADIVTIEATDEGLTLTGKGDTVKAEVNIGKGSGMLLALEAYRDVEASFKTEELIKILPKIGDIASLHLASDMPIKTEILTQLYGSQITFWLGQQ
jgi:ATP-dependent protease HslVU (ClpYQ) peptidase subunit